MKQAKLKRQVQLRNQVQSMRMVEEDSSFEVASSVEAERSQPGSDRPQRMGVKRSDAEGGSEMDAV